MAAVTEVGVGEVRVDAATAAGLAAAVEQASVIAADAAASCESGGPESGSGSGRRGGGKRGRRRVLAPADAAAVVGNTLAVALQLRCAYLVDVPGGEDSALVAGVVRGVQRAAAAAGAPTLAAACHRLLILFACGSQMFVCHRDVLESRLRAALAPIDAAAAAATAAAAAANLSAPVCCVASRCRRPHWCCPPCADYGARWRTTLQALADVLLAAPPPEPGAAPASLVPTAATLHFPDDALRVDAIALVGWLLEYGVLLDTTACAVADDGTVDAGVPRPHCLSGEPLSLCSVAVRLADAGGHPAAVTFGWSVPTASCSPPAVPDPDAEGGAGASYHYDPAVGAAAACAAASVRAQAALDGPAGAPRTGVVRLAARVSSACAATITL